MGRKNYQTLAIWLVCSLLFITACVKDKPNPPDTSGIADTSGNVFVVCEGSLGNGNSSLSLFNKISGSVIEDAYYAANGKVLGDVFQSMTEIDGKYFLCINNSDKIVVISKADKKYIGSISVSKPRYILPVSEDKAYVSTLFSKKIYIINPKQLTVKGSFDLPYENPEGMLLLNGEAFICPWDTATDKMVVVNTSTDAIDRTITVAGRAPHEVLKDKNGLLWIMSGNVPKKKDAALTCIDPFTGLTVKSYLFPPKADPIKPIFNTAKDMLYFIEVNYDGGTEYNGIYKMSINDAALPAAPFIPAVKFQYFWALGIEPSTDRIFVGDPKGFIQRGVAHIYSTDGTKLSEFNTGVGPGHFYFE